MANSVSEVLLTEKPLEAAASDAISRNVGASVDFWGIVREMENGHALEGIEYEAHSEMANHQMKAIAEAAVVKFGLEKVILHHRTGFVLTGEPSLFLRVQTGHRAEAFEASRWIVDELKKKVPIWKKPTFKTEDRRHASHSEAATA